MHYLHLYTGNGKGKTTCSTGLAIRAAGTGKRVAIIYFDKGFDAEEHYSERAVLRSIPGIEIFPFGAERILPGNRFRFENLPADFEQAAAALTKARELILAGEHFLIVCDEAITCTMTKLISADTLMEFVREYKRDPKCELVLTGRGAFQELLDAADLVTEMHLVKHYFQMGVPARRGIEF